MGLAFATGSQYLTMHMISFFSGAPKCLKVSEARSPRSTMCRMQFEPNSNQIRTVGIQGVSREMEVVACALPGERDRIPLSYDSYDSYDSYVSHPRHI